MIQSRVEGSPAEFCYDAWFLTHVLRGAEYICTIVRAGGPLIRPKNPPMTKGKPETRNFLENRWTKVPIKVKRGWWEDMGYEGKRSVHEIAIDQDDSGEQPGTRGVWRLHFQSQ